MQAFFRTLNAPWILLAVFVAASGCAPKTVLASKVQAAGGATALQAECAGFVRAFLESYEERNAWLPRDTNFPPAIASFRPQMVAVTRQSGGVLLVDVRITGGFKHHGLLVAPAPMPAGFQPRMSNWLVWEVAPGVWEYRE